MLEQRFVTTRHPFISKVDRDTFYKPQRNLFNGFAGTLSKEDMRDLVPKDLY